MKIEQIINKYRNISKPAKASLWFIISSIFIRGISFFTLPLFTRLMTTEQYGILNVYYSWGAIVTIFTTLTLWGGVINVGMVKYPGRCNEVVSSFQGLATALTAVFFITACCFLSTISDIIGLSELLITLIFIEILVQIPFNIWATKQRYFCNYKWLVYITIFSAILNPILGYILVINTEYKAEARIISGIVIQGIIGIWFWIANLRNGGKLYSKELWSYAVNFSIVLIPYYLSLQILNQSDRIMISRLCGDSYAGIYGVAYNFAMLIGLITNGIYSSLTPYIYQSIKNKNIEYLTSRTTAVVMFVGIVTIGIICFVPDLFLFMLPNSYYPAIYVIPPVTLGAFYMFIYPLFSAVEMYYEENQYISMGSVAAAIINVILNYFFIGIFGFIAAAYTTLLCYMILAVAHYILMRKVQVGHNDSAQIYDIKKIFVICFSTTFLGLLILQIYDFHYLRWSILLFIFCILIIEREWCKKVVQSLSK